MKTMTCNQLAGACEQQFHATTFEEISEKCRSHAAEMVLKNDQAHIDKMNEMMALSKKPGAVKEWYMKVQKEFDELPEDN